jgi:hypothetical protein
MKAGAACKFTVHFSTSFFTTSLRAAILKRIRETAVRASGTCWIESQDRRYFHRDQQLQQGGSVTHASRNGEKRFGDNGMLLRQRIKTVTHVVELPNFLQDRFGMHGHTAFLKIYRGDTSGGLTLVQET